MENAYSLNSKLMGKEVVICGTGTSAKAAYFMLSNDGVKIKHFSEVDERYAGKLLFGLEIIREDDLIGKDYAVVIASHAYKEIDERLQKKGIKDTYRMLTYDEGVYV